VTTWISRADPAAIADAVEAARAADPAGPLAGVRLAVKDNIDVAGLPTTAGCPAYAYEPERSATVVDRLVAAGAVVAGKTNLDQFATGLVGTRSPYGAVVNPLAPDHVPGGSSSGSAVAVATGEADIALGTDTAGSGRVPAAFCGVVGLKPTPGWLPDTGVIPACRSFDCVSVFARDVRSAATAVLVAAGPDGIDPRCHVPGATVHGPVQRVGVPSGAVLERWCGPEVVDAFAAATARLADLGLEVRCLDLGDYFRAGDLLYGGALVAERFAAVGAFVRAHRHDPTAAIDPSVGAIIDAAGDLPAHRLAADLEALAGLRHRSAATWLDVDAVVVPTAPGHPTVAEVAADPIGANAALGRFTNGCNLLGWCAAAVPVAPRADGLPFGVSVLGPAWADRRTWDLAADLAGQDRAEPGRTAGHLLLAVCGAHLEGQPLHHQLTDRGAELVRRTTTAAAYRMACLDTHPPKPGLTRLAEGGHALEVEVYALSPAGLGTFVDQVPSPLTIGTVELADGSEVKGFLCEPHAADAAPDISRYGGWRAWLSR
jgi:allophanate hydrolase